LQADGGRALGILASAIEAAEQVAATPVATAAPRGVSRVDSTRGAAGEPTAAAAAGTAASAADSAEDEEDADARKAAAAAEAAASRAGEFAEAQAADDATAAKRKQKQPPPSSAHLSATKASAAGATAAQATALANAQAEAITQFSTTVWYGEDFFARPLLRGGGDGSGGSSSVGVGVGGGGAAAALVPLLCWQAARLCLLRAASHRRKLDDARRRSLPVPKGSANSLRSAWTAAKSFLEKGLQCPFPAAAGPGAADGHLRVLLAWHLAALAATGNPPGGRGQDEGSPAVEAVEGRRAASHFAFARDALLAAAYAAAAAGQGSASGAADARGGGGAAAAALLAARGGGGGSRLSPRPSQQPAAPLPLLATPERCCQLALALARADAQAGRLAAAANAVRACVRRGSAQLWARHALLALALRHAVEAQAATREAVASAGVPGGYADDAEALAAEEAAARVRVSTHGLLNRLKNLLFLCFVSCIVCVFLFLSNMQPAGAA
jgi:hypothetical protein